LGRINDVLIMVNNNPIPVDFSCYGCWMQCFMSYYFGKIFSLNYRCHHWYEGRHHQISIPIQERYGTLL
jgi:hypothetical protein